AGLIGLVEDGEGVAAEAERARLGAQDVEAEAVERGDVQVLRYLPADERDDALAHLGRGLVGEGDGQDGPRRRAALDEPRDAVRDDAGLARAGAGEHEHGPEFVLDGGELRWIEADGHSGAGTLAR